jgi:4-aminobutyrate aminotransferase/(S)-3-amino-2-methylpropionate transaminase
MPRVISLKTAIPGPRSLALAARRAKAIPRGVPSTTPLAIVSAEGSVLTDADGNRLIDFGAGIGVMNVGHSHPRVVAAIQSQLANFTHVCFPVSGYEAYVALAERLNALTPGSHEKRTFFVNSGAEAVENAIKAARHFTKRQAVVCYEHAFHGRTYLGMALTSKVSPYKKGFGPFAPEVYRIPFPYCYRCPEGGQGGIGADGLAGGQCCMASRDYLERQFAAIVDPDSVAAIIIEPELGEGGFVPVPKDYMTALAEFARAHGIVLIADEIQTGFGRTGKLFASEHYGLVPDLMTTAKSLAGGLPLAAVTGRADILDSAQPGGLGGTYGGNPLACAAALAVLDAMEGEKIPERAAAVGQRITTRFKQWQSKHRWIGDVRGLGAMVAIELVKDPGTREPDKERTTRLQAESLKRGVILLSAGTLGNVIRVLVPLTVSDAVLDEGLDVMEQAVDAIGG